MARPGRFGHAYGRSGMKLEGVPRLKTSQEVIYSPVCTAAGADVETFVDEIISDRFGLNYNFIEANHLTWIDNLETSSGGDLASTRHPDHSKPYVQDYLARFGARKCEANALVVTPDRGCAQKPWRPQKRRTGASRKVR